MDDVKNKREIKRLLRTEGFHVAQTLCDEDKFQQVLDEEKLAFCSGCGVELRWSTDIEGDYSGHYCYDCAEERMERMEC